MLTGMGVTHSLITGTCSLTRRWAQLILHRVTTGYDCLTHTKVLLVTMKVPLSLASMSCWHHIGGASKHVTW